MSLVRHVKAKNVRRKFWRCRDCKFHRTNITKEELLAIKIPNVEDPCDTNPNEIICFVNDNINSYCFEPLARKVKT